jgi:hypothetical protein
MDRQMVRAIAETLSRLIRVGYTPIEGLKRPVQQVEE